MTHNEITKYLKIQVGQQARSCNRYDFVRFLESTNCKKTSKK